MKMGVKVRKPKGKREAQVLARDIEKGLLREKWSDSEDDPGAVSFQAHAARWLGGKKIGWKFGTSLSCVGNLSNHLLPSFRTKALRDISRADVRQF
jgi:hypothetical protein